VRARRAGHNLRMRIGSPRSRRLGAFALVAAAVASAVAVTPLRAQTVPPLATSVSAGEKAAITYFVEDSYGDVQLGQLGLRKARNAAVRSLARTMVRDHTRTADAGMRVAQAIGDDDAQAKAGDDNQIQLTHLARYDGARFDREYVAALVDAHKNDIATAENALEFATTPAVRAYLTDTVKTDTRHLALAQAVQQVVGGG
jgi:putative membrane protein